MEEEIRYCIETVDNYFITSGYVLSEGKLVFSDGGEEVISVPVDEVLHIIKETVSKEDITTSTLQAELASA